jgi:hypothetical protein
MTTETIQAASDLIHLQGEVVKAVKARASQAEIDALVVAADRAREVWQREVLRGMAYGRPQ